ncbi:MAG: hypothetical protein WCV88_05965 [Patescibacteria group bacterium]|jgi:NAD(P)H-dependent FMN reductase
MKKLSIILGSTRQNRFGETVANWVMSETKTLPNCTTQLLDYIGADCRGELNLTFATKALADAAWTQRLQTVLNKLKISIE